jgi:hypothetical protein
MDSLFVEKYKFNIHSNKTDRLSYNRFYGKIANELKGIDKIYVSPDGVFQKINLYTLFNPNTNKYLIDEQGELIKYFPSTTKPLSEELVNSIK